MKERDGYPWVLDEIAGRNNFEILRASTLAGGDINEVFQITTAAGEKFAVKLNDPVKYPGMFLAEKTGLEALRETKIFTVPKVLATGVIENKAYLLLQYINSTSPVEDFWNVFGKKLADLHKKTNHLFGFDTDNYIGSLPQKNGHCSTASEFYISQRLEPQFRLAKSKGFKLGKTTALFNYCLEVIPDEPPSLIHGDLWSGNYLADSEGQPGLIDPAVSYAPRELDLAMMKLFGGFSPAAFESYNFHFPLQKDWEKRIPLWQLYYLLVHLNIFGAGYLARVTSIIDRYS
ncbi:fructosamine kinase family protein [Antarcticibacterium sp. 1MA-6-2]|uniref:fructosamine kinase family protein n=1 Tax=Antarcticibacterium sp. 1MA-6-2 TaxID=2908210 RepID=UPI001F3ABB82|nr:fructosamine kinase family protein [Antarcticibacterium sp. 1MA-6-2]UJH92837.1 fructosamine kinase family protein [Antarcticibacterium sp. 1MA-6-2]